MKHENINPEVLSNPYAMHLLRLARHEPAEGDYIGPDGLIWCGKCRTPRQFVMEKDNIFHGMTLPIPCACRTAAQKLRDDELFASRVRELRRRCFSEPAMAEWTFAHDDGGCRHSETAQRYVRKWETDIRPGNIGLYLWGDAGAGKSYLAGCIANALIEQGVAVRMLGFPELLADLSANLEGRGAYIRGLCEYPLLILDDYGTERSTEFVEEQIFALLDARWRAHRPLIMTSNLPPSRLTAQGSLMHSRIADRILGMCTPLQISGPSRRAKSGAEKAEALREALKKE